LTTYLFFTPDNWSVPQQVRIQGRDDGLLHGDVPYVIHATFLTVDPIYSGLPVLDVRAINVNSHPLVVDTTADENDGNYSPGHLGLREAIDLANNRTLGVSPHDTITFAAGLNGQTNYLDVGQLAITAPLTITGNGAANTILEGRRHSGVD